MFGGCVPIVTKECDPAADLIDESIGCIVTPGDADDLAHALKDLLANPNHLAGMSINAKTRYDLKGQVI